MFFPIGKHAIWHPEILKQVAAAGHTIGSHTWSHADLSKLTVDQARRDREGRQRGARGARPARSVILPLPGPGHSPELLAYLGAQNIGIFSTDMDLFDFKMRKPER